MMKDCGDCSGQGFTEEWKTCSQCADEHCCKKHCESCDGEGQIEVADDEPQTERDK